MRERAAAMVERVAQETAWLMGTTDAATVRDAVATSLAGRDAVVEDDHDPRLLHPARTVLILLSDGALRQAHALAAAAFVESIDTELALDPTTLDPATLDPATLDPARLDLATLGPAAAALLRQVPPAAAVPADELLERLISAPAEATLLALAERLDHARHLHLRPELPWPAFHAEVENVWVPVANRISAPLARRFQRWAEAFGARQLLRHRSDP